MFVENRNDPMGVSGAIGNGGGAAIARRLAGASLSGRVRYGLDEVACRVTAAGEFAGVDAVDMSAIAPQVPSPGCGS